MRLVFLAPQREQTAQEPVRAGVQRVALERELGLEVGLTEVDPGGENRRRDLGAALRRVYRGADGGAIRAALRCTSARDQDGRGEEGEARHRSQA
jgi:hypothetical protein